MGLSDFWSALRDRAGESASRANDAPGYLLSILVAEVRPKLSELVSNFIGDVFMYLKDRDNPQGAPGNPDRPGRPEEYEQA
jgi:hypothetical protein